MGQGTMKDTSEERPGVQIGMKRNKEDSKTQKVYTSEYRNDSKFPNLVKGESEKGLNEKLIKALPSTN